VNIQVKQPADQVATLKNALKALTPFIDLRDTMPLQCVMAFMLVATEEGLNISTYAKRAGISGSLMARHLEDLGDLNRYRQPGFGLVEQFSDPMDRRNRLCALRLRAGASRRKSATPSRAQGEGEMTIPRPQEWTKAEVHQLRTLAKRKVSADSIAKSFGRHVGSVRTKALELRLILSRKVKATGK